MRSLQHGKAQICDSTDIRDCQAVALDRANFQLDDYGITCHKYDVTCNSNSKQ